MGQQVQRQARESSGAYEGAARGRQETARYVMFRVKRAVCRHRIAIPSRFIFMQCAIWQAFYRLTSSTAGVLANAFTLPRRRHA